MEKIISKNTIIGFLTILLLLLAWLYWQEKKITSRLLATNQMMMRATNERQQTTNFLKLFLDKVLRGEGEVAFEDRLKLENTVRDLGEPKIEEIWKDFTESETEEAIQKNLKLLLDALINKLASLAPEPIN